MVETLVREPERQEKKLMQMIHDVLDDVAIGDDAELFIEGLTEKGMKRVAFDQLDQARALEARENFRVLAESLRQYAKDNNKRSIGKNDVDSVLASLCPIYPIC